MVVMKRAVSGQSRLRVKALLSMFVMCAVTVGTCLAADPAVPAPPAENYPWMSIATWHGIHESFVKKTKADKIDLLFLGDSIMEQWRENAVWKKHYSPLNPANFGIGGDLTQNVLWRVANGEVDAIKPKVVVLLIGTNNTGNDKAEDIARGITAIVQLLGKKLPATKVLLLGILPRGAEAKTPLRDKIAAVNEVISKLADGKSVWYLDLGPKLLDKDGKLPGDVSPDSLHLSEKGYQVWAETMDPLLKKMMAVKTATGSAAGIK